MRSFAPGEEVCDFLVGDNDYRSTAESLDRYFLQFAGSGPIEDLIP